MGIYTNDVMKPAPTVVSGYSDLWASHDHYYLMSQPDLEDFVERHFTAELDVSYVTPICLNVECQGEDHTVSVAANRPVLLNHAEQLADPVQRNAIKELVKLCTPEQLPGCFRTALQFDWTL